MSHRICVIGGDGIGPEVTGAAVEVLRSLDVDLDVVEASAGWGTFERTGTALPGETLDAAREADAVLFGAVSSPSHRVEGYRSPIVQLRRALDLYACVRPTRACVIVRENTEGLYAGRESRDGDAAVAERLITRAASERIARFAGRLSVERDGARRVTVVHKANVMRETCGLFREAALDVLGELDVEVDEMLVDNAAYRLAQDPARFDVIVTTNMFGDILSDVAAVHDGGLGVAASANLGEGRGVFEPVHGSAPDIAGRGIANPVATLRSAAMMLRFLGEGAAADELERRMASVEVATPDVGGRATMREVIAAVGG